MGHAHINEIIRSISRKAYFLLSFKFVHPAKGLVLVCDFSAPGISSGPEEATQNRDGL